MKEAPWQKEKTRSRDALFDSRAALELVRAARYLQLRFERDFESARAWVEPISDLDEKTGQFRIGFLDADRKSHFIEIDWQDPIGLSHWLEKRADDLAALARTQRALPSDS